MGKDGSQWKHGYIPENGAAIALKAHKSPGGKSGGGGKTAKAAKPKMTKRQAATRAEMDQLAGMHKTAQAQAKLTARAKASLNRIAKPKAKPRKTK